MTVAYCAGCGLPLGPEAVRLDERGNRWLIGHTKDQCAVALRWARHLADRRPRARRP